MAAKTEAKPEAPPAAAGAPAAEAAVPAAPAKFMAFLPLIAVVVLAPALTFTVGQFVLLPQLKKQLDTPIDPAALAAAPAKAPAPAEKGKDGKPVVAGNGTVYKFDSVVVNLAGTMGTRYLKTSFEVMGSDDSLKATFEAERPKLVDVTLNVLSSLSLADLEEAGAKNLIRERLIAAYNQALGKRICDQIYFSDFVVQ